MDTLLLGITVVSLIVALVTSVTAWRLMRDERRRSSARIAALAAAAGDEVRVNSVESEPEPAMSSAVSRSPWKPAPFDSIDSAPAAESTPATGFLGSTQIERDGGNRQRGLAIATVVFFIAVTGGFLSMMSGSNGDPSASEASNGAPLELVSLNHARQGGKLAVSGLVRNPVAGRPVEKLSAVVFLFDRSGSFVTSSRTQVDFLKLGAGDETPFVVSIDAPESVARYRVSFRTDDGVVPHIDRRGEPAATGAGEQPINVSMK